MKMNTKNVLETVLAQCSGVIPVEREINTYGRGKDYQTDYYKSGDIELPESDIFIEIIATATNGTIARIVGLEVDTYGETYDHYKGKKDHNKITSYGGTFIYEVDGRKQKGRIKSHYTKIVLGQPETKYVRDVQKHEKVVVKNPVNKFKQELQRGDWVIGVKRGHSLGIGRITRWTNSNVWGVTGDDLDDKLKEFQFASISETFTMPNDEHIPLLTMAILKGWKGH